MIVKVSEVVLGQEAGQPWVDLGIVEVVHRVHLAAAVVNLPFELAEALVGEGERGRGEQCLGGELCGRQDGNEEQKLHPWIFSFLETELSQICITVLVFKLALLVATSQ